ncbi:MAG: hypothetical protein AB1772_06085 [Candidatus Zixiibacteriota bacterium]
MLNIRSFPERTCLLALVLAVLLLCPATDTQAIERLRVTVGDTTGTPGQQNSVITVFLTNTQDQIAAFSLHLFLSRNDIANFQNNLDTVVDTTYWKEWCCTEYVGENCVDSVRDTCAVDFPDLEPWDFRIIDTVEAFVGNFDTVGTLISGWEMVTSRSVSTGDLGLDILVTGIADRTTVPGTRPPINPQQGGVLFRILADIFPIPPELEDRTAGIIIDVSWKPYFVFSTPAGTAIGWITVQVPDTNYYECTNPVPPPGTGCYEWTHMPQSQCTNGCDSVAIVMVDVAKLDSTQVKLFDGQIEVLNYICGDVNHSGDLTIGDITMLIDHLFITGVEIVPIEAGNVNCSTEIPVELSIGDVTVLIDRLFITQTPLCCE